MIKIGNYTLQESVYDILLEVKRNLTNGKLHQIQKRGGQVRISCPFHGETEGSCFVNEDGIFNCFGCHTSGRFPKLIGACFDADEKFGKAWLIKNYVGDTILQDDSFKFELSPEKKEEFLDESILDSYEDWHPYLEKRHLSRKICELFKVKYDKEKEMIVFPVYDEHKRLYMLTRRSVKDKTFLIDKDKEKPVYLLYYILSKGFTEVTICESQINCLTCYGFGYPAVALFGTGTKYQYKLLNKSGIRHYYLAFDGDIAGRKGIKKFIENIRKDVLVDVIMIPDKKDVNDLTEEEFNSLEVINSFEWMMRFGKE